VAICTKESYSGVTGTLKFNVTQFTNYSAEETPAETPTGGGRGVSEQRSFRVSVEDILVFLKQGEKTTEDIIITNNGNQKLDIILESPEIEDFVEISEKSFTLDKGESKKILIDISVDGNAVPRVYIGHLFIETDGIRKDIPIIIEVESKETLFDISIEIPEEYLYISPGDELFAKIDLQNLVTDIETDVKLEYIIRDINENVMISETEIVSVEDRKTFAKVIKIPKDIELGRYVLYVRAIYDGKVASSSQWFTIGKKEIFKRIDIFSILLIILILIFIVLYKYKKDLSKAKDLFKKRREIR
jgi:uncharacterized membrane protein